jgi:hypothetical protein
MFTAISELSRVRARHLAAGSAVRRRRWTSGRPGRWWCGAGRADWPWIGDRSRRPAANVDFVGHDGIVSSGNTAYGNAHAWRQRGSGRIDDGPIAQVQLDVAAVAGSDLNAVRPCCDDDSVEHRCLGGRWRWDRLRDSDCAEATKRRDCGDEAGDAGPCCTCLVHELGSVQVTLPRDGGGISIVAATRRLHYATAR